MAEIVWAIDPGPTQSALVVFDGVRVRDHRILANDVLIALLRRPTAQPAWDGDREAVLVIEQMAGMGMAVGWEVFETCYHTGRFAEAWPRAGFERVKRLAVKLHLCGSARAKDANVRQALIDRFGPTKETAIGVKAAQGPLYGFRGDEWAALALAVTWWDAQRTGRPVPDEAVADDGIPF